MKIVFTGDLFTGGLLVGYEDSMLEIAIDEFKDADIRVVNLEQASSDNSQLLQKSTVHAPIKSLNFLTKNNINIVSLANNHIQDKGKEGFYDGLVALKKIDVQFLGAGINIEAAQRYVSLTDDLVLLAYCDNNKPYLKKIQIATEKEYGVNPFSYEKVISDIEKIPDKKQIVLYLHWGKENIWFPPKDNIKLAKKLLDHPKVYSIIGSHSHRMQGKIKHNGKYAYFSLGNFLFPNFYMAPRTQMVYPETLPSRVKTTREYHPVFSLTKKVWKYSSRVSVLVTISNGKHSEVFVKQKKTQPVVIELKGIEKQLIKIWFNILSIFYKFPSPIYSIIEKPFNIIDKVLKLINISFFYFFKEKKFRSLMSLLKSNSIKNF